MSETNDQRFKRLRLLVPNCVPDATLRVRVDSGWSDHQIVTTDLRPYSITGRADSQMFRARGGRWK